MKFAEAIERCINGARITRRDWNGKGMFVYYTPGRRIPSKEWIGSIEYKEIQQDTSSWQVTSTCSMHKVSVSSDGWHHKLTWHPINGRK